MQVTQKKSQVFGLNKMEEALVMLKQSSYTSVTSQDWQGVSASAGATSSSDGVLCTPYGSQQVGQEGCFHTNTHTPRQLTIRPSQQLQLNQIAKVLSANTMCHSVPWFAFG